MQQSPKILMSRIFPVQMLAGLILAASLLGVVVSTQVAYARLIIVPDDFSTIQGAINDASDGDTVFVRSGTYYEHVVVDKTIALVGEDRDTVIIDGGGAGVVVNITRNNVNMTGFTVRRSGTGGYLGDDPPRNPPIYPKTAGIYLQNVTGCLLFENKAVETYVGIQLEHGANRNVIANNTLRNNGWAGIGTHEACWNSFLNNNVTDNLDSIMVRVDSNNNTFTENVITASNWGVTIDRCSNNTIARNQITSSEIGINLQESDSNHIFRNDLRDNYAGIQVFTSQHNKLSENELAHNYCAIEITDYSSDNEVSGNDVTENSYGVGFWLSDQNIVYENNISHSKLYGVLLSFSRDNKLYHNNLVNNTPQMSTSPGYSNILDDGYPSGGNYWSDYTGMDVKKGLNQEQPGSDGLGDTPRILGSGNLDYYPLVNPFGSPPPPNYELVITASTSGTTNLASGTYTYSQGQNVPVQAIPENGYILGHWELDGANVGSTNPYSVPLNNSHSLHAVFIEHHDVAITKVILSKTVVVRNCSIFINVTLENPGDYSEHFNVTVKSNMTAIGCQTVDNLLNETSIVLTFTWNTTDFAYGNYTVSANASTVGGETNITNNVYSDVWAIVTIPGDVGGNFKVDMGDIDGLCGGYDSTLGADGYYWHRPPCLVCPHSPNCDVDSNGRLDIGDINYALDNFGKHHP